jgi:hypothetical protein
MRPQIFIVAIAFITIACGQEPGPDPWAKAESKAVEAQAMSNSGDSPSEWREAKSLWLQADLTLNSVPENHPNYGQLAAKRSEYQEGLEAAKQKETELMALESQACVALKNDIYEPLLPNLKREFEFQCSLEGDSVFGEYSIEYENDFKDTVTQFRAKAEDPIETREIRRLGRDRENADTAQWE